MKTIIIKTQAELDALQRVLSRTVKNKIGCWEFCGARSRSGYGKTRFKSKDIEAHRLIFFLLKGPIKKGMDVAHDCDNPACVNPSHLRALTRSQNLREAALRGRIKRGHKSKASKLSKEQADECVRLRGNGWSLNSIGSKFGVCGETVRRTIGWAQ